MNYTFECQECSHQFDESLKIADRDNPKQSDCPVCSGKIKRMVESPAISYQGSKSLHQRAGSEFNNILKEIKKRNGRLSEKSTIKHQ